MKKEDINHLSKEELQTILCDFYNELDTEFYKYTRSGISEIKDLLPNYINISRKVLHKIK